MPERVGLFKLKRPVIPDQVLSRSRDVLGDFGQEIQRSEDLGHRLEA